MADFTISAPPGDWTKLLLAAYAAHPGDFPSHTVLVVDATDISTGTLTPLFVSGDTSDAATDTARITQMADADLQALIDTGLPSAPAMGFPAGANGLDILRDITITRYWTALLTILKNSRKKHKAEQVSEPIDTSLSIT